MFPSGFYARWLIGLGILQPVIGKSATVLLFNPVLLFLFALLRHGHRPNNKKTSKKTNNANDDDFTLPTRSESSNFFPVTEDHGLKHGATMLFGVDLPGKVCAFFANGANGIKAPALPGLPFLSFRLQMFSRPH